MVIVGVYFIGPFTPTTIGNYMHICVCICHASSYVVAWPTRNLTAKQFATDFYNNVCTNFGTPKNLISDRGATFTSSIVKELSVILGIQLAFIAGYHPQTNGQTERVNQTIVNMLRCLCASHMKTWNNHLQSCIFVHFCDK